VGVGAAGARDAWRSRAARRRPARLVLRLPSSLQGQVYCGGNGNSTLAGGEPPATPPVELPIYTCSVQVGQAAGGGEGEGGALLLANACPACATTCRHLAPPSPTALSPRTGVSRQGQDPMIGSHAQHSYRR
jgi:hypothetical protein